MTLSEFASSVGLTVPQILARAVEIDAKLLCTNPGAQLLSDEAETRLRELIEKSQLTDGAQPPRDDKRRMRRERVKEHKERRITPQRNFTIDSLASEYDVDPAELREVARSLGYQTADCGGSLSIAQVDQLLLRLNESAQLSFGDTSSITLVNVIKNAGKLREQPQSQKTRRSPNLRRTRLETLAEQWGATPATLSDVCKLVRITVYDPTSPRIANGDIIRLRAALQASAFVADRWGTQSDVRLSKIASNCRVPLALVRQLSESLGITLLKRDRIYRNDAVYLLVEIEATRPQRLADSHLEDSETAAGPSNDECRNGSELNLCLDGLVLTDQDFSFGVFKGASFRGCELTRANFTGANLAGADFSSAIMRYAVFENALLEDAVLDNADVRFADFTGVVLSEGQLTSALIEGASFGGDVRQ